MGLRQASHVAGKLDHRHLHPQADPQVGYLVASRILYCADLALDAALAKTAGDQDGVHTLQGCGPRLGDVFRIDVLDVHLAAGMDAGVGQCLDQGLIGFLEMHVFTDHS